MDKNAIARLQDVGIALEIMACKLRSENNIKDTGKENFQIVNIKYITFTDKPVNVLGCYFGTNTEFNWVNQFEKAIFEVMGVKISYYDR